MNAITPFRRAHSTCFVQLHSGACVDLLAPDFSRVTLTDIGTSLSRLPRFLGSTRHTHPLSVAQHSLLVMHILEDQGQPLMLLRAALLHDAHEAVMGDIPTPVKAAIGSALAELEGRLQAALFRRFGLAESLAHHPVIRWADRVALHTERRDLLAPSQWDWPGEALSAAELWPRRISPEPASQAYGRWWNAALRLRLDEAGRAA